MATDPENIYDQLWPTPAPVQAQPTDRGVVIVNPAVRQEQRAEQSQAMEAERLGLSEAGEARAGRQETRTTLEDLRKEYRGLDAVKDYEKAIPNYAAALRTQPNGSGDLSLVYYFAKTIDPGSSVQQGEMANIQTTDARLPAFAQTALRELRASDGVFTDTARAGLRRELHNIISQRNLAYRAAREQYRQIASSPEYGVNPDLVVGEHSGTPFREQISEYWAAQQAAQEPQEEEAARVSGTGDFMTAEDRELLGRLQSAYNAGAPIEELQAITAEYGRTFPLSTQEALDAARREGRQVGVDPSGRRTVAEETLGAVAESPVGAYFTGATNALLSGGMDEIGGALGMDAETIQLAKEQLRKDYPVSSFAGEASGQMLQAIPVMRGGQALGLGARGLGALEVVQGAAYGAGEAPEGERLTGAAFGAGGAVVGQQVAQRLIEPGIQAIIQRISRDTGAPREAVEQLVEESFGGGAARQSVPEVPPVGGAAPEVPPSLPAGAAPPPAGAAAPEVPAPTPTPPRAPSVAEQQGISEEMVALARRAAGRGPGSSAARAELRAAVEADPALIQQAEALGLELPADVFSANEQLKNLIGLARSQPGSAAEAGWQQTVANSARQIEEDLLTLGAADDLAGVSNDILLRMKNSEESLMSQGAALRDSIPELKTDEFATSLVQADDLRAYLERQIRLNGGIDKSPPDIQRFAREFGVGIEDTSVRPTYHRMDSLRDELGAARRGRGPWVDMNERLRNDLYNMVADARVDHVRTVIGDEAADALEKSNEIFSAGYAVRDHLTNLFGRDLDRGIGQQIRSVIAQGASGDTTNLNRMLQAVPENQRSEVILSGILANARSRGAEGGFNFANFRNTYRALRRNETVYRELARNMTESQRNFLENLYGVSQGIADAQRRIISTGRARGGPAEEINAQSLTQRIVEQATRRGVGAGTGMLGGTLLGDVTMGIPAAVALESALAYLGRGGASNLDRVSDVIGSAAYRDLVNEAGRGGNMTRAINRLANSRPFGLFARGLGLNTQDARRAWIRSALAVGATQQVGGEPAQADSQAIMVEAQQ